MSAQGVLDSVNLVSIHVRLNTFSHSITMEAFTPTRYKTAEINYTKE